MVFSTVMQGLLLSNRAMGILKTRRFHMDDDQKLILLFAKIFNEINPFWDLPEDNVT
jgi:hypothetical protein